MHHHHHVWVFLVICMLYFEVFLNLTEVFPCFFLSCKANARVNLAKTGHGPQSSTLVCIVLFGSYLCCSVYCLCVNVYCHRVTTQLQLINISYTISWAQQPTLSQGLPQNLLPSVPISRGTPPMSLPHLLGITRHSTFPS